MLQFLIAAAIAMGLVALWAAMLPLTAQPAPAEPAPALSKALFLCRDSHGINRACAAALARALVLDTSDDSAAHGTDRYCVLDPQLLASHATHH